MATLAEIAVLFLKLGFIAFGGPAVHIALMEEYVVRRLKWMTHDDFLDLIGITNLVPGPNSTEMVMQCGMRRGGLAGLVVAGVCFIGPAVILSAAFAYMYAEYGTLPAFENILYGIRPAVLILIIAAVYKLGRKAAKSRELMILGICVLIYSLAGGWEIIGILAGGFLGMLWLKRGNLGKMFPAAAVVPLAASVAVEPVTLPSIFGSFFKIGATFFGGGYTIFAYFEGEFITRLGWLNHQQILDAVAVGQFTPGPVLSSAAFLGYQLAGFPGALAASVGIFLPSFLIVALIHPWIDRMRGSPWLASFLDAVNISAVAVMVSVIIKLGLTSIVDWKTAVIACAVGLLLILRPGLNGVWLILAGGLAGWGLLS